MRPFDRVAIVDWSAASKPTPARPGADAIWIGIADGERVTSEYHRTRESATQALLALCRETVARGERLLLGADFPFGYPAGFAAAMTGRDEALALWNWLSARIEDRADNSNNRFALAAAINAGLPGTGPFWGRPASLALPDLPTKGSVREGHGFPERRLVETRVPRAQSCWKLFTTGSVGSQALTGIARLARLREALGAAVAVWPFEDVADAPVVLAEVYPSLVNDAVAARLAQGRETIKDAAQVAALAEALMRLSRERALAPLFAPDAARDILVEEGWILGVGNEDALASAAA